MLVYLLINLIILLLGQNNFRETGYLLEWGLINLQKDSSTVLSSQLIMYCRLSPAAFSNKNYFDNRGASTSSTPRWARRWEERPEDTQQPANH